MSKSYLTIKLVSLLLSGFFLSACSIDASLDHLTSQLPSIIPVQQQDRTTPDFIPAEVVTSATGYKVRAVVGELTEKRALSNGYKVEGTFYE